MAAEQALYEYLIEQQVLASPSGLLKAADIHDSVYQRFSATKPNGVRIGDADADVGLGLGATGIIEFDVCLTLVVYARVPGKEVEKPDRAPSREVVTNLAAEVMILLFQDGSLGDRVCNRVQIKRCSRGWDKADKAETYAVMHIPLAINATGKPLPAPYN